MLAKADIGIVTDKKTIQQLSSSGEEARKTRREARALIAEAERTAQEADEAKKDAPKGDQGK
jgi:hypothetical protein